MKTNMRGAWELVAEQLRASLACQETADLNQDRHARFVPANHDHHNMLPQAAISHQRLQRRHGRHTWTQTARQLVGQNQLDGFLDTKK